MVFLLVGIVTAAGVGTAYLGKKIYGMYQDSCEEEYKKKCRVLLMEIKEKIRRENSVFRFLFFGITQHGKSTLCNGLWSAYKEEKNIVDVFQSGSSGTTFTKGFCPCKMDDNLWLIDMGGIFESNEIDIENIGDVLEGRVPFNKQLGENLERLEPKLKFQEPESNDLACVVIVMKPKTVITKQLRNIFKTVDSCAQRGRINRILVVTYIEEIHSKFKDPKKLLKIEKTSEIEDCRQRLSKQTGIPSTSITFVRNYWDQRKTDVYINYILLELFSQLLQSGINAKTRAASKKEL